MAGCGDFPQDSGGQGGGPVKIYSMTATFGKRDHETLTLKPGLNVISAGNEWGKSTWCAFLAAMLYGVDTRAKSTKHTLADKERYAPWSGSSMSGRIDLNWDGRDITIERKTTGRIPLGDFRAYETATGLTVTELTAANCGEKLLGVERSVFLRTGFIRFSDLNLTDDEALRRRLNNLVTTGDESSAQDRLAGELKNLKNRIRHNRTGLLPQAEAERDRLEEKCRELKALEAHNDEILRLLDNNEDWRMALENHRDALAYAASLEDARKVRLAEDALADAQVRYEELDVLTGNLPDWETAREKLEKIHGMQDGLLKLQHRIQELPQKNAPEALPEQFRDMTAEAARDKARNDTFHYQTLQTEINYRAALGFVVAMIGLLTMLRRLVPGLLICFIGLMAAVWGIVWKLRRDEERRSLEEYYGSADTARWRRLAEDYEEKLRAYELETAEVSREREELEAELDQIRQRIRDISGEEGPGLSRADWEEVLSAWEAREEALIALQQAKTHYEALRAMARQAKAPEFHDRLEHSEAYTLRLLEECLEERTRLENQQGQCRGSMEAIGSRSELEKALEKIHRRIGELEHTYDALTIAQETLAQATAELQRRFAPRISRRAGELMCALTEGRYDRLSIDDDLSLRAGAKQEDTLREALWRSDGTVDQLYLSLRLAVAEELLPNGPLVLDDALVRFDDKRAKCAMDILKDEAMDRQVILFTCHSREAEMV